MAFHYFSDITGEAEKLSAITGMPNKEFAARWHPVGLGPYLRLLARGTIRRHLLQAPFHLLSIHVHLVSFVDCEDPRFAASTVR